MTGHYDIKELNGSNCAIVESGITHERAEFVKHILDHNRFTVIISEIIKPATESTPEETSYTVGVTDTTFNLSLALYSRHLKTPEGKVLLPEYWKTGKIEEEWYWMER